MDEVLSSYILAFDEINALMATSYAQADRDDIQKRVQQIADDLLSFLIKAYKEGIRAASIMLAYDLTVDTDKMYDAIYAVIDGKDFEDRVITYILADDLAGLQMLAESEYHRVYQTAVNDGAYQFQEEGNFGIEKTWHTLLDNLVRDTHRYLEGMTVALEEEFYTYDGDHARFPGDFGNAANNVHCRCYLTYRAMVV